MIKIYAGLVVLALVAGIWLKYTQMESRIELQNAQLINKEIVISTMADNVVEAEIAAEKSTKKAVFDAVTVEKKTKIEEGLNYDKTNSVDITSTRFYL